MAEIAGSISEKNFARKKDSQKLLFKNTKNGLNNEADQDLEETRDSPNYNDARITEEKIKLLQITIDLQEMIINILRLKFKMLEAKNVRNKRFNNVLTNAAEDVHEAVNDDLKCSSNISGGNKIWKLQQITKLLEGINTSFIDTIENILGEIHLTFLNYKKSYKKCNILLTDLLTNFEETLKFNKFPGNCSLSVFENFLASFKEILASTEKDFNKFNFLMKRNSKIPRQDIKKRIYFFSTAFEKAELAYKGSKSLVTAVQIYDVGKN